MKDFIMGIDLHGTLLDKMQKIPKECIQPLIETISKLKKKCIIYTCTGNDFSFVEKVVPKELLKIFDGHVLETGCSVWKGREVPIASKEEIRMIKNLESRLREMGFSQLNYFARRLCTISMFTKNPYTENIPKDFQPVVENIVRKLGFLSKVNVTYSSVAVDIIPKGYDKFTGLEKVSEGRKIISIADSMNDINLLKNSEFAFTQANASMEMLGILRKEGKKIISIEKAESMEADQIIVSKQTETFGLLENLEFILKSIS